MLAAAVPVPGTSFRVLAYMSPPLSVSHSFSLLCIPSFLQRQACFAVVFSKLCVESALMASSSAPGDTRWDVVYSAPSSKRKIDGLLILRCVTPVVKKLLLYDLAGSTVLASRYYKKFERICVGDTLTIDPGYLVSVNGLDDDDSSFAAPSIPSVIRPSACAVPSTSHSFLVDEAPTARVGTRWNVLYTRHPNKKFKRTHDGVLQLAQKTQQEQKVVLFDNEGTEIDQRFLSGGEEITCGKTLEFDRASVEVTEIKEDRFFSVEGKKFQETSAIQKRLHWQRPASSFQGTATSECGERDEMQASHDRTGRPRNTSMPPIQPKRRNSAQILNRLKRPIETTNCSKYEQLEREGTPMLSSASRLPSEEERSATRDRVDHILKLNIVKACPEESADERVYTEHGVVQHKSGLGNHRPRVVDIQYSSSVEQTELEAEMVESEASPQMERGAPMRVGKRSIKPFRSPQTNGASVANQCLPIKHLSLDFQVDVSAIMRRKVTIPDEFNSLAHYQNIMFSAIIEELNIILYDLAKRFGTAKSELSRISGPTPICEHGATELKRQFKDGKNNGRLFYTCKSKACNHFSWADESGKLAVTSSGDDLEQRYDCCNIEFYSDCELLMRSKKTWGKSIGENASNRVAVVSEKISVLLKLSRVKRFAKYSKDDIWVISSNSKFCKIRSDDFVVVAVSKWYGPSTEGVIELELLGQKPRQLKGLFALHDRGVVTELKMLDVIRSLHPSGVPLLPLLLCSKQPDGPDSHRAIVGEGFTPSVIEDLEYIVTMRVEATLSRFQLNSDQEKVLRTVGKWFACNGSGGARVNLQHPELCLVHGTFGSGKSFLLVVLVIFITELLELVKDSTSKILISAATNIAVDRILVGLLEHGFSEFIRVGTLENISKSILPYSVYTISQSHGEKERTQELQQLIKKEGVPSSRRVLEEELRHIKEGKTAKRREKLKSMRVVGVTCHSCTNPVLEGQKFTICILDECSQMPEPLSLLPLGGCTKLIAVGDPAQLPPTLSHVGAEWEDELSSATGNIPLDDANTQTLHYGHDGEPRKMPSDLRRALFVRLAKAYRPILLRTQYRCHPRLTAVPNSLFYEDKLINGCRDVDRPPLVQGLPPLLFCDTGRKGLEKKDGLGFKNEYEADLVSQILTYLVSQGIPGVQIGVIVFYKSQAMLVQQTLRQIFPRDTAALSNASKMIHENNAFAEVQVSTVDAFQGMEKSIILLSCCRTNGLGFVTSSNRLNVALTRARHHLIIIGKAENLHNNICWKKLLSSVRSSPGSYKPAQEFVAILSANRKAGLYTTSHLRKESVGRDNFSVQECSVGKEASSTPRSSQAKSAGLVDYCHCSEEVKNILDDIRFRAQDFWEGYKLYCFGHYSHCELSREQFLASKMGRVVVLLQNEAVRWGAKFDATVRHVWVMMEEYLRIRYDKDCTNLRALLEEFEDEKELSTSENGLLLLQLVKDDAQGTEHLHNQAHSFQLQSTDIFDQFQRRLNQLDANLGNLLTSSGVNSDLDCHNLGE